MEIPVCDALLLLQKLIFHYEQFCCAVKHFPSFF